MWGRRNSRAKPQIRVNSNQSRAAMRTPMRAAAYPGWKDPETLPTPASVHRTLLVFVERPRPRHENWRILRPPSKEPRCPHTTRSLRAAPRGGRPSWPQPRVRRSWSPPAARISARRGGRSSKKHFEGRITSLQIFPFSHREETLPELRIHYTVLGKPHRDAAWARRQCGAHSARHGADRGTIFLTDKFSGVFVRERTAARHDPVFSIILPGRQSVHGQSSRPQRRALHAAPFPQYDLSGTWLAAQYAAGSRWGCRWIICGSCLEPRWGCMHTWMWGEKPTQTSSTH